jgi:aspartate carbamoyltransferase catalytic subunit
MKHLISATQFTDTEQLELFYKDVDLISKKQHQNVGSRTMATLFYQSSTRTRLSFESAMYRLGGDVISTENAYEFSSHTKGESLEDTIRVVSGFVDVIVLRHPDRNSAEIASKYCDKYLINGGSGWEHPTQSLLDCYTIRTELGRIEGTHIAMIGDLLHGRTVHSLIYLMSMYKGVHMTFAAPTKLHLPAEIINFLREKNVSFRLVSSLYDAMMDKPDVVYLTRAQQGDDFSNDFIFNEKMLEKLGSKSIIMHPLPRQKELPTVIDKDPRAAYFREAQNGLYVRMAILQQMFSSPRSHPWDL